MNTQTKAWGRMACVQTEAPQPPKLLRWLRAHLFTASWLLHKHLMYGMIHGKSAPAEYRTGIQGLHGVQV